MKNHSEVYMCGGEIDILEKKKKNALNIHSSKKLKKHSHYSYYPQTYLSTH